MSKLFNISLPKWPALSVVGCDVTKEQAAEIIIRTQDFFFLTNDKDFLKELSLVCGIKRNSPLWEELNKLRVKYNCLGLQYLKNQQIASSYVHGPYGWCDWEGTIKCNSFNIGKWPCIDSVFDEWTVIAKAFPYLQLTSQLWSGETCEDNIRPLVEFSVTNGEVSVQEPTIPMMIVDYPYDTIFTKVNGERGCTIEQFKDALRITQNA